MKHIPAFIYTGILCLLLACSCNGSKNNVPEPDAVAVLQPDAIPEDAIPFQYLYDTLKMILVDAVLNGTDSIAVFWDTGTPDMVVPLAYKDSLKGKDSVGLRLGDLDLTYKGKIYFSDKYKLNDGKSRMVVGPSLFRDKIVEISYDRKYLRVLDSTDGLEGYKRIPYRVNRFIYIPISVCIQGKVFHIEDALIDTGFNVALVVYEKDIPGIEFPPRKELPKEDFRIRLDRKILADTIKAAGVYTTDMDIHIATPNPEKIGKMEFPNLLGNEFLSRFSVVFDFKNQNLYLKPLKE